MSRRALFVDPGVTNTGASVFDPEMKRLISARRFRGRGFKDDPALVLELAIQVSDWARGFGRFSLVVFEWPQIYRESRQRYARKDGGISKRDPNALLPLAALDAAICAFLWDATTSDCEFKLVRPADWKGQKKPNPTAQWVIKTLSESERANVEELPEFIAALHAADLADKEIEHPAHNTLDAVGIGLHWFKRLSTRVIER